MEITATTDLNLALRGVSKAVAAAVPSLAHVRPARLLFVYNSTLKARARVLPLAFDDTGTRLSRDGLRRRPLVRYRGRVMHYVIEFGRMFLRSSPTRRLQTLVHELIHVSPFFNGTLARAMRHSRADGGEYKAQVRAAVAAVDAAVKGGSAALLDCGESVICLKWRRPFSLTAGGTYDDEDLKRVRVSMNV